MGEGKRTQISERRHISISWLPLVRKWQIVIYRRNGFRRAIPGKKEREKRVCKIKLEEDIVKRWTY